MINSLKNTFAETAYRIKHIPSDTIPSIGRAGWLAGKKIQQHFQNKKNNDACHFGMHWTGDNAGDVLLYFLVKKLFEEKTKLKHWKCYNLRKPIQEPTIEFMRTRSKLAIVGGGGLFIPDSNPNSVSGWQWNISKEQIKSINCPLVLFAVGYNNFRYQKSFSKNFESNLKALIQKASFVGMRNKGSIERLKEHIPHELHAKIKYQPCPTVFSGLMCDLPDVEIRKNALRIAINVAFDRWEQRFKCQQNLELFLDKIACALKQMHRDGSTIYVAAHAFDDMKIIPYLRRHKVPFELHFLARQHPLKVVEFYGNIDLTFGMRGHAQMIPFGRAGGIFSLVSHEKMWYFLQDMNLTECGCEVLGGSVEQEMIDFYYSFSKNYKEIQERIRSSREKCWTITKANLEEISVK